MKLKYLKLEKERVVEVQQNLSAEFIQINLNEKFPSSLSQECIPGFFRI